MNPQHVDVVIVGAGPAGSAAAHALATAGRSTLLVDKATFPRDKFCGDGLTTLALRQLEEIGIEPERITSFTAVDGAWLRSPSGKVHAAPLPDGPGIHAAVARRIDLDQVLVEHAIAAGAQTRFGSAITSIDPAADHVGFTTADGGAFTADLCIAADGMWSPTRKMLGLDIDGYRGEWHAFRQYWKNVGPLAARELWVWFEPDLLPGYMWSFPVGDGRANVGFGVLRGGEIKTQQMKTLWPDLLERDHIRSVLGAEAEPESPHRAWPIPARVDAAPLVGPRTMFVGDAATACDALTGEGIGQALLTGRLAAAAFVEHSDVDTALANYEDEVRSELVADHRMASTLGKWMSNRMIAELALTAVGTNGWTRRNFARWMFEDYPRAILATPRRWSKGVFTGDGAYADRPDVRV